MRLNPSTYPPDQLADDFLRLHLARFGEKSVLRTAVNQQILREVFPKLYVDGNLVAFGLYCNGELWAIDLAMVGADSLCPWNGGFLEKSTFLGPMVLLFAAAFETAIELGFGELDLLRGATEFKTRWCNQVRTPHVLTLEPNIP